MNIVVLTPVRLLGDGLAACCNQHPDITVTAVVNDLATLRQTLTIAVVDLVLIDVTQGVDLYDVRSIAAEWHDIALVALGLTEQRHEVIRCGRAGFWDTSHVRPRLTRCARRCRTLSRVAWRARPRFHAACCMPCSELIRCPTRSIRIAR